MAKHVIYGNYECKNIRKLDGLQDPMVEIFLQEIKKLNWDHHQLWTHGSILGDSTANDIDLNYRRSKDATRSIRITRGLCYDRL